MTANDAPRFVADKMLGRLARWLRILGCDVLYGTNYSGKGLLAAARADRRVVLTRDRRLVRRQDVPEHLFVDSDHLREQLRQVVAAFALDPQASLFQRCVECNGELEEVGRDEAAGKVPAFVLDTQSSFRRCRRCRHLYWDATHVDRVRRELEGMGLIAPSQDPVGA